MSIVAHIDMNSYFASVEQQDHPEWRGQPLGVCEHLGGMIIAASVEAKKWGIKTGTPVWDAKKLYPKIILTKTSPDRYRYYTERWMRLVGEYSGSVEQASIDEAYIDLTPVIGGMPDPYAAAEAHMRELKARFPAEVGDYLRCSVGIANSKLVAKIASDLQKPDGMVVVRPEDVHKLYDVLELTDIPGIASRSAERLKAKLGIHSLKELRDTPLSHLVGAFGRVAGYHMWAMGQLKGSWKEKVHADPSMKSMGHMYTLPKEYRKPECMLPVLSRLSEMVATRLRKKGVSAGGVSAFVRVALGWEAEKKKDHRWFGGALPLGGAVTDGRELFLSARKCLESELDVTKVSSCYMVTITAYDLAERVEQLELFRNKPSVPELGKAMDAVNTRYGAHTLTRGTSLQAGHAIRDSVGFGRVKEK